MYSGSLGSPGTEVRRGYEPEVVRSKVRISRHVVSLADPYLPAQVWMGVYKIASVGEWKPGKKSRSWILRIWGETSARGSTKEGEYGTSLIRQYTLGRAREGLTEADLRRTDPVPFVPAATAR